jgi:restriction system protein
VSANRLQRFGDHAIASAHERHHAWMTDRAGRVRRRRARSTDSWLVELLSQAPWWFTVGLAIASIAVGALYRDVTLGMVGAVVIMLAGLVAAGDRLRGRRLAADTRSVDDLCRMSWQDFELLVAEAFRRSGYRAELTQRGADGGVDILLTKGGGTTFVQCKQNTSRLDPRCVRELAGVMASEQVAAGIVVASGGVGDEGQAIAKRSGIRIMDGTALVGLLLETGIWTRRPRATPLKADLATYPPSCPRCHADMIRRVSSHGPFWGCRRYPSCRGTRALEGLHAH